MIRLFIEDQELDTTDGFSHQITYAVDDLNNLDSKTTNFSKTIVLPGTANNNKLLGNIYEFANSNFTSGDTINVGYNFNATKSAKCRLEFNGLTIIKGVMRLMEIIRDGELVEYEIAIFGELGGFFNKLQNKKLEDLDFSQYDHTYNYAAFNSTWLGNDFSFTSQGNKLNFLDNTIIFSGISARTIQSVLLPGKEFSITNTVSGNNNDTYLCVDIRWYGSFVNELVITIDRNVDANETTDGTITVEANPNGTGYYYPLIDYGNVSDNKQDYNYRAFRPALFVYEYLDKIIQGAGYTWESRFFETPFFRRLIVPHNQNDITILESDLFKGNIGNSISVEYWGNPVTQNDDLIVSKIYGQGFTTTDQKIYTYIGASPVTLIISYTINIAVTRDPLPNKPFNWIASFTFLKNGNFITDLNNILIPHTQESFSGNGVANQSKTFSFRVSLNTNDTIEILADASITDTIQYSPGVEFLGTFGFSGLLHMQSTTPVAVPIIYGNTLEVNRCIPKNILQKDFFASILKLFYLMVTEDKFRRNHLVIEPWTWFYNLNTFDFYDWTDKIDRSQPIRIKPMSEANARYYELKYKQDNDYYNELYRKAYNENYGNVRFDNELEFSKDSESSEVIFSPTPLVGYGELFNTPIDKVVSTIFKWDGKVVGENEERITSNIRIMQKKVFAEMDEWLILDDSNNTIASTTDFPYAGHFDDPFTPTSDLNFGATRQLYYQLTNPTTANNLFNTFYSSYLAEITDKDSRLVTAKIKLNELDIFYLDFSRFVWIEGVLYRLQRIVDYVPNEICTVELLRCIYTTYDNTVNNEQFPVRDINNLLWTTKNYDGDFLRDGTRINKAINEKRWEDFNVAKTPAWCYFGFNDNNAHLGKYYNFYAIIASGGFAPQGYRMPTRNQYAELFSNTDKIKVPGIELWNTDNGTNILGFNGIGHGFVTEAGSAEEFKNKSYYWTSEIYDSSNAYAVNFQDDLSYNVNNSIKYEYGCPVRFIREFRRRRY